MGGRKRDDEDGQAKARKMGGSRAKMKHGQGCVVWYVAGGMPEMAESTISLRRSVYPSGCEALLQF